MRWRFSQSTRKLEQAVQSIPTWIAVMVAVVFLAALAIWMDDEAKVHVLGDLFSRQTVKALFASAEPIAVVAAVILYFKGAPDRKAQKHYEAWRVIDSAANISTSYARFRALQDLHQDGVSLQGLDAPGVNLSKIELPNANLSEANLPAANLQAANLQHAQLLGAHLQGANLQQANLRGASLRGANLQAANLQNAELWGADLRNTNLQSASLRGADLIKAELWGANLQDAELRWAELHGNELQGARLCHTIMPDGTEMNQDCGE
ncbi:MAG: pentapeptide repeat-containing protein [Cyanothece sp. SIO1E1]|nr:pentapeptide repeat-containing protein [Cyanothece sp. SIO1E1]